MAPLSSLAPHQRAVLSLVLEKGRTFAEIATLMKLDEPAIRERAHLALDALAPRDGARPAPRHRAAIGNYLLGQEPARAAETFAYLEGSVAGRDWARHLAAELDGLAAGGLPPIPVEPPPAADPPESTPAAPPRSPVVPAAGPNDDPEGPDAGAPAAVAAPAPAVSRRGGALLIAGALAVAVAVVVAVLIVRGSGTSHAPPATAAAAKPAATPPATLAGQITLTATAGGKGYAAVIKRGTQRVIAVLASGLRPTSAHLDYGVWLYNTAADFQLIGYIPQVKADGRISAASPLPGGAARFHTLLVTREPGRTPRPGQVVFRGTIPAAALG